jgi:hypothetical protein
MTFLKNKKNENETAVLKWKEGFGNKIWGQSGGDENIHPIKIIVN